MSLRNLPETVKSIKFANPCIMKHLLFVMSIAFLAPSCHRESPYREASPTTLTIFHAGSLSVPFRALADSFSAQNPDVRFRMEAAGSLETIRKITELGKQADIVASADERLIQEYLIPDHASWSLAFAGNEMVIAQGHHSKRSDEISVDNWSEVLLEPGIAIGRSNPDLDPCGYRTVLLLQLAEKYYDKPGLTQEVLEVSTMNVRPKETDLIALLQTGHLDFIFTYRSIAVQHNLNYVALPDEINLSDPAFDMSYKQATTQIKGRKPGDLATVSGEAVIYGLTIPNNAPNKIIAERFVAFILSKSGQNILALNGHRIISGLQFQAKSEVPEIIRKQLIP